MQDTLDLSEAAALLKVDTETARQLAADGAIYAAKIGRSWVFLREDLLEYLRQQTREQTAKRRRAEDLPNVSLTNDGDIKRRKFRPPPPLP